MRRHAVRAAVAGVVIVAALVLLFPTDGVVRRLLARYTPPGFPPPTFERAHLGLGGLVLDTVTVAGRAATPVLTAPRVRLRPSLAGLVFGRGGHPWELEGDPCGGTARGLVATDGPATTLDVEFADADLAACPVLDLGGGVLAGRARGTLHLRLDPQATPHGNGRVELAEAVWRGQGVVALFRATSAAATWRLEEGKLTLAGIDVRLPALTVGGNGQVVLAAPPGASELRLALTLTSNQGSMEPRRILVAGTLARPQVVGE